MVGGCVAFPSPWAAGSKGIQIVTLEQLLRRTEP
jgi:hypothetical protein